jgi:serine/threonine-protein kinase
MVAADRNLLYGILALQMDFVGRDDLLVAMHAWVLRKSRTLGEILVEHGSLKEDERRVLDLVVEKHLERHGNDAQRSLHAVPAPHEIRKALELVADYDVQASLAQVGITHSHHENSKAYPDATCDLGALTTVETSDSGGRFRILRLHDRGGLGEVFVALDRELNREVALKRIQEHYADDMQRRARFLVEAEINGGLEHPGIVPVYGLGSYAAGRPFYAMRFIKGDNLKAAVKRFHEAPELETNEGRRALERRRLLARFLDVCNAVSYAHSRGVLHRDLKPGNIMLGKFGETLLVDWGLAKSVSRGELPIDPAERTLAPESGSDVQPTEFGARLGTPAFMSPEQAAGRLDQLGPASDVYSLGATLYFVLTGKVPFEDPDLPELLRKVEHGEFPPPRLVNARVDPALNAICLKAMSRSSGDRYRSVRALADELEHWLADEPVVAYDEPLAGRLARWGRHHKSILVGVGALLLTTVVGLSIGTILLGRANARTERQRQIAYSNAYMARRAVDEFFTQVSETKLLDVPGLQGLRKDLLTSASRYYEKFLEDARNDPATRAEAAQAAYRVGFVALRNGNTEAARGPLEQAVKLYEALVRDHPDVQGYSYRLAMTLNDLGRQQYYLGKGDVALGQFRRAVQIREDLVARYPLIAEYRKELAIGYNNLATLLYYVEGWLDESSRLFERARMLYAGLIRDFPSEADYRYRTAIVEFGLGNVEAELGRIALSRQAHDRSVQTMEAVVDEHPSKLDYQVRLADALVSLAWHVAREENSKSETLVIVARAIDRLEPLVRKDPEFLDFQQQTCNLLNLKGRIESETGQVKSAVATLEQARRLGEHLYREHPDDSRYRRLLAESYLFLGRAQRSAGEEEQAAKAFALALELFKPLAEETTESLFRTACTFAVCSELAIADESERERYADRALDALQKAVARGFRNADYLECEPDLSSIRSRPEFQDLQSSVRAKIRLPDSNASP